MSNYADLVRRDRRSLVLVFLEACALYTSNGNVILSVLESGGVRSTRDELVTELWWLKEQGFVDLEDHEGFIVVTGRQRGIDIALGAARHPEVSRPHPKR